MAIIVRVNEERALQVIESITELYDSKRIKWFSKDSLPQNKFRPRWIKEGSYEHRCWLFSMAILARANQNSDDIFWKALRTLHIFPSDRGFFLPKVAARHVPVEEIRRFIKMITGNYLLKEFTNSWQYNAKVLGEKFDWDPAVIFEEANDYKGVRKLLDSNFRSIGPKIAALLIEWFEESGLINSLYGCPPLDFHLLRFFIATCVIEVPDLYKGRRVRADLVIRKAIPLFDQFFSQYKIANSSLDPAIWIWSRTICTAQAQCYWCPVRNFCNYFFTYGTYRTKEGIILETRQDKQMYFFDAMGRPKTF